MKKNIILNLVLSSSILMQALPTPYNEVKEILPFNGHGWYGNGKWIEKLMTENKISRVIEIGSWLGCSTRHIASLLQPNGKLYAIDTWKGSIEHYEYEEYSVMLPTLYDQFLSNVIHAGFTDIIVPIRMASLEAVYFLSEKLKSVDMVYVDAAHDTESVFKDLQAYYPFIKDNNGILCGDDWTWGTVRIAVRKFAHIKNLSLYYGDNFWFLKKESKRNEKEFEKASNMIWKFNIQK